MVKNNILRVLVVIFSISTLHKAHAVLTAKDLDDTNAAAKAKIDSLRTSLEPLPPKTKEPLINALNSALTDVTNAYNKAQGIVKPLANDKTKQAALKINSAVDAAQRAMNISINNIQLQILPVLRAYEQTQTSAETEQARQKAAQLTKEKVAYQKKMQALFSQVVQLLPSLNKIDYDIRQFLIQENQKSYKGKSPQELIGELHNLALKALPIYQAVGPIAADDRSSLVVVIIKKMSDLYSDLLFNEVQQLRKIKQDITYYKGLSDLSKKVLLSDGYDNTLKKEITIFFSDAAEQKKIFSYYLQKRVNLTYVLYGNALLTLGNTAKDPSALQLQYALDIYTLLMNDIALLPKEGTAQAAQSAHETMAMLYVASAQSLLTKMNINEDTQPALLQVIDFYKQAATYFTQAQDGDNVQRYTNLFTSLSQANDALKKAQTAEKAGDSKTAIEHYKTAQTLFLQGGDGIDADKINIVLSTLEVQYSLSAVKDLFLQFMMRNKAMVQTYLTSLTAVGGTKMISYDTLFASLVTLYQSAYTEYSQALDDYQATIKNNPSLKQSADMQQTVQNIGNVVAVLNSLNQAQKLMQQGDQLLSVQTSGALSKANQYYAQAISFYQQADTLYKNNNQLDTYAPRYFLEFSKDAAISNFTALNNQHIAAFDRALAADLKNDAVTALLYYNDAHNRSAYLTTEINDFITSQIAELSKATDAASALLQEAQTTEKTLLLLTADAWAAKKDAVGYVSDATAQWNSLLQNYLMAYRLGNEQAKAAFSNAVQEYAQQYKRNVPGSYYPELGIAMILYYQYLFSVSLNEQEQSVATLKDIEANATSFFDTVETLLKSVANSANLVTTATLDQEKIVEWSKRADQAVSEQAVIIGIVGNKEQGAAVRLFEKIIDVQGALTYSFLPSKKTVTFADPLISLAALFKQQGDFYFKQKDYVKAYPSYYRAKQLYAQANKTISFDDQLALADTLYLASQYRDLIIPKGSIALDTFKVPESYEIKIYGQTVPVDFTKDQNLDFLKTDPTKTAEYLLSLATKMYIYNKISDSFSADQFNQLFPLLGLSYDQLTKNPIFQALSDNQKVAFVLIVANASKFNADLKQRIAAKTSSLVLMDVKKQDNIPVYALYEYYVPVPCFSDPVQFYQKYPAVINYYTWAAYLFKPGPAGDMITIGSTTLPHGNEQQEYDKMITAQIYTYLSQGYFYQTEVDAIMTTSMWKELHKSDVRDFSVSLGTYWDMYTTMNNHYGQMIGFYDGPRASRDLLPAKSPLETPLNKLIGGTYKKMGDTLAIFLIGDPLSHYYITVLKDIVSMYISAIETFNYDSNLYSSAGDNYTKAGELLIAQQHYFDSISFFYTAAILFKKVTPETQQSKDGIEKSYLKYFRAMFKGSTLNMAEFHKAYKNPLDITLSDHSHETISFDDLLVKYLSYLNQLGGASASGIDPAEVDESKNLKSMFLDALIYYKGCKTQMDPVIQELVSDAATLEQVSKDALSLIHSFTDKNKINLDDLSSVTLMMERTDFVDGKDFTSVLENGFEQFAQKVVQSKDKVGKAVGYSAIAEFALRLHGAFSFVYIDIYLGGISGNTETILANLAADINAELNEILSPSKQYIG